MFTLASCLVDQPAKSTSLLEVALVCLQAKVTDETIVDFARLKLKLSTEFVLEGNGFSDIGLILVKDEIRNFQRISIKNNSRITDRGILSLNFPENFSSLEITGCPNLTESSFKRVFESIPKNLEILSVGKLTPPMLSSFVHLCRKSHFNNLQSLKVEISRSAIPAKLFPEAAAAGASLLEEISRSDGEEISRSEEDLADAAWVKTWRERTSAAADFSSLEIPDVEKIEILKLVNQLAVLLERFPVLTIISVSLESTNFQEFSAIGQMKAQRIQAAREKTIFADAVKRHIHSLFPAA